MATDFRALPKLRPNKPNLQPFYYFDIASDHPQWQPTTQTVHPPTPTYPDRIHLISWNIDFSTPAPSERMSAALQHLNTLQATHDKNNGAPTILFFQEMVPSDLKLIQEAPWIRDRFYITDISHAQWRGGYGTTTLVDRRLALQRVFRVPFASSTMGRDGLFVDIRVKDSGIVRLCNTHLESLQSGTPARAVQLKLVSEFMRGIGGCGGGPATATAEAGEWDSAAASEAKAETENEVELSLPNPRAAIVAGDLNAIASADVDLPGKCGLSDAFLALGGTGSDEEGFTWGYQRPGWVSSRLPCGRLDKVLFCGGVAAVSLTRIGRGLKARVDVRTSDNEGGVGSDSDSDRFEDIWVTDHFGLGAEFRILPVPVPCRLE
ncbi:Endonuclease/exonuclease/phosphatase [Aspergillus varians]